jgi:ABC-type lipoprotein export system ATPase subunit
VIGSSTGRPPLLRCAGLWVTHRSGDVAVNALRGVDLEIRAGEHVALHGRSGSGKTTLLHALGGLITLDRGSVEWLGRKLSSLDSAARGAARAEGITYVFQGANLIASLDAWENVALAARAARRGEPASAAELEPDAALAVVGLGHRREALPDELSGGEAQRVAIARALAQSPRLLLCDEPTGHLDQDTGRRVLDLIEALRAEHGFAIVIATHDPAVAARADRTLELVDGRVAEEVPA